MKKLFGIKSGDASDPDKLMLCLRVGERHFSYAIVEKPSRSLLSLAYFTGQAITATKLDGLRNLQPELNIGYKDVVVCYDYPWYLMAGEMNTTREVQETVLETIHPSAELPVFLADRVGSGKENIYRVPAQVHEWIHSNFSSPRFIHQYSLLTGNKELSSSKDALVIDFRQEDFVLMVVTGDQPVLLQTFEYVNPDDVLYYLLKTCEQFGLRQGDVRLRISGLIDRQSGLYTSLYQYFNHSDFRETGWNIPGSQYPGHFFTTLNDVALCGL